VDELLEFAKDAKRQGAPAGWRWTSWSACGRAPAKPCTPVILHDPEFRYEAIELALRAGGGGTTTERQGEGQRDLPHRVRGVRGDVQQGQRVAAGRCSTWA